MRIPGTGNIPPPQILLLGMEGPTLGPWQHVWEVWRGGKGPLVPFIRVTSVLTIVWGCGHAPAESREAGAGALWVWGLDPSLTLCGFKTCLAQTLATP